MLAANAFLVTELKLKIPTLSLDRDGLRRFLDILTERCTGALALEMANLPSGGRPEKEIVRVQDILRGGYLPFITLTGYDGTQLNGTVVDIFGSPNFPDDVATVFFDSAMPLRNQNFATRNSMILFLDFRRPAIFDFRLMPSQETPNESNFSARGLDPTWVHGVFHEVDNFVRVRRGGGGWLHRHTVYDILVWLLGLPLAFWISFRASPLIERLSSSEFLHAALYVYVWFATLIGFRAMFHYARWLWPLIEYRRAGTNAVYHRAFWATVSGGLLLPLLYDILKKLGGW